jgi:multicomponent Na+:H+ antiporter subunit F
VIVAASLVVLTVAGALFGYRMIVGPTLADRVIALNGLLVVGASAIAAEAVRTGRGAFIPVVVALTLVGFVGTAMVARFIETRGR